MGFLATLWMPILLSAVLVFVVSSLIHMVLGYHAGDVKKLPNEDAVMDALRKFEIPAGDYQIPRCESMKDMKSPAFMEKMNKGPVALMTFMKTGAPNMGKSLGLWFLYSVIVSVFAAYLCDRTAGAQPHYLAVFRIVGCAAFMGYALALMQNSIWYGRNWCTTIKTMFDGLIYALVTGGVFGWLWPR